ncbi:MAG: tetratricopeptide repeat-containing sensor histidine kinase [Limnohabitans sp.]|nr:tetratricopeptide repeat-containing sensor histidine kinase [Limnohabitans sp.]
MNFSLKYLFIILFLTPFLIFGQSLKQKSKFEIHLKKQIHQLKNGGLLSKPVDYYLEKNWDSTLVLTQRLIESNKNNQDIISYSHFLRGLSLKRKILFDESKKEFSKLAKNFYFYPKVTSSLAEIALEKNEAKKAISIFKTIENINTPEIYDITKSSIKHNLGVAYLSLKDFINAEKYLLESTKLQEIEKDTVNLVSSYGDVANLYYEQYKDNLAIPYFEKAYNLAKLTKSLKFKAMTANNMSVVEENRKNFEKANHYRKEYGIWKDSLNDQNKIWEVAQIEKQYAVKEKQKQVNLLQIENKLKIAERNGFLYSALVLLFLFIITIYFYREKSKQNRIISIQKDKLNELNSTKDKLFSIVSHDLRSSVNALKTSTNQIIENVNESKWEDAASHLKQNSALAGATFNLLDNLLHWALLQNQQSFFEIAPLKLYFTVEQVCFNYQILLQEKGIEFSNLIPKKATVSADQETIKIVLRNLLDNAIKFSNQDGYIKIEAFEDEKFWNLIVEDNGKGMNEETKNYLLKEEIQLAKKHNENIIGSGLGLQLCKSMILKNHGKLNIESAIGKGTKMIVSLPKQETNGQS